jgi:hypothetical protein
VFGKGRRGGPAVRDEARLRKGGDRALAAGVSGFTFFVAYGRTSVAVDLDTIEVVETETAWSFDEITGSSRRDRQKIVVVGACTASTRIPSASTRS